MTKRSKPTTKTLAERRAKAAADIKRMRMRHKDHAGECLEVLRAVLAEQVCDRCGRLIYRTMSELTSMLANEPVWAWTADGEPSDWNDRYDTLREVVYQMRKKDEVDSHVVLEDDGVHRRIVRLHTDGGGCECEGKHRGGVVVPFAEYKKKQERKPAADASMPMGEAG